MILKKIKKKIRTLWFGFDRSSQYFSQGGEDAILKSIFYEKSKRGEKGFFVDVGAYHPYVHSNTYFFYIRGWQGINIDACPGSMALFNQFRPRDINLEIGIADRKGVSTYYLLDKTSTMNSFSKDNLSDHGMFEHVKEELEIEMTTLEAIFTKYSDQFTTIDFLSIDVEGFDYEVLKSNNWNRFKPNVIVVELNCKDINDIQENVSAQFLQSLGYQFIAKNVIMKNVASVFFVAEGFDY